MMTRRVFVGLAVVGALGVFALVRPGKQAKADTPPTAEVRDGTGGNYDDAAARYRTNQSRHWKQIVVGTH